jgi:hypothetical protein
MEHRSTVSAAGRARFAFASVAVAAALVLVSAPADAAMWLRMSVDPPQPLVGQSARVTVLTMAHFSSGCTNDPAADARPYWDWNGDGGKDLRFELKAFQADRVIDIPLTRRESDLAYWDGNVAFPATGEWTVRMVRPLWAEGSAAGEECAGSRITVTVRPPSSPSGTPASLASGPAAAYAALLLGVLGAALFGLQRMRSRARPSD